MKPSLAAIGIDAVDGVFLDIGVSSPQIDDSERGFSFRFDGPLDMRMDTSAGETAAEWLMRADADEIARVIADFGEERFARRIAGAIVAQRKIAPLATTGELARLVEGAVPKNRRDSAQHPATRTFQAIRIQINHELDELREALDAAASLLSPEGRLAVISFHSLEDRIVKKKLQELAQGCICPPEFPVCVCGRKPKVKLITRKPIVSGEEELAENPRARSAKLRVAEKC